MKKIVLLLLCAAVSTAFAQKSTGPDKPQRTRLNGAPKIKATGREDDVFVAEPGEDESAEVSVGNQKKFDEIMGSFSALAMKFSQEDDRQLDVFVYDCQHISGKAFGQMMEPFLSVNGELSVSGESDLVVISDVPGKMEQLKQIAKSIDRPIRQVLVNASVIEFQITDGFEKDLSLQYNQFANMEMIPALPGGGLASSSLSSAFATRMMDAIVPKGGNPASLNGSSSYLYYDPDEQTIFSAFLTFLERNGSAQILSAPSLILRRGHSGNILSGEDIPVTKSNVGSGGTSFSVDYKSVGIKLRVTPQSIFDDRVVLEVSPEVSNIIRYEESSAGRNPVVAIRNANTLLEMQDGYMVSIGGLLREEQIKTERRIPLLGNIPLLGTLFRASSSESIRSQLVIFLSVKIVNPEDLTADTIQSDGVSDELQHQIQTSSDSLAPEKKSILRGVKRLFE